MSKGQALITIEASELKALVVYAEGAVAQAEARMRQLKELTLPAAREALTQAQATLLNAQQTYDRTSELAKNGHATKASLDEAQKNLDVARTQVRTAELQVFTSSQGGSDYVMAETQLNQARANLEAARSRFDYTTIVAPRDGVLIATEMWSAVWWCSRGRRSWSSPRPARPSSCSRSTRRTWRSDRGRPEGARFSRCVPRPDLRRRGYLHQSRHRHQRASVEVKLSVPEPPDYLRQDMTVSVDIEIARSHRIRSIFRYAASMTRSAGRHG